MTDWANEYIARCQVPASGTLVLDHVAHFVPDADEAATALQQLGFTVTPFSPQSHRPSPEAALTPAGTGKRCARLRPGYPQILIPTAHTPLAHQPRPPMAPHSGNPPGPPGPPPPQP